MFPQQSQEFILIAHFPVTRFLIEGVSLYRMSMLFRRTPATGAGLLFMGRSSWFLILVMIAITPTHEGYRPDPPEKSDQQPGTHPQSYKDVYERSAHAKQQQSRPLTSARQASQSE